MLSIPQTQALLAQAREAYKRARDYEKKNPGRRSHLFQVAETALMTIINENEVSVPTKVLDQFEGLMDGDAEDVREAFRVLGQYAQQGLKAAHYDRKHRPRGNKRHPDFTVY